MFPSERMTEFVWTYTAVWAGCPRIRTRSAPQDRPAVCMPT